MSRSSDQPWYWRVRSERRRLRVTRAAFAYLIGVPVDTLRRWEDGSRHPSEQRLREMLTALKLSGKTANEILEGAGYHPDPTLFPNWRFPNYFFARTELPTALERVPWPAFVLDNNVEVIEANLAVQAIWGVDFGAERTKRTRAQMSLLSVASNHQFVRKLVNWDECVGVIASVLKGQPQRPESLDEPSRYFNEVLAEFAAGDPAFLSRFLGIFAEAPAEEPKVRGQYPVVWKDDEFGTMRFLGVRTTASESDGFGFNDWIPIDADSWSVLERVKTRHATTFGTDQQ